VVVLVVVKVVVVLEVIELLVMDLLLYKDQHNIYLEVMQLQLEVEVQRDLIQMEMVLQVAELIQFLHV
jgi:hypothetical protein